MFDDGPNDINQWVQTIGTDIDLATDNALHPDGCYNTNTILEHGMHFWSA